MCKTQNILRHTRGGRTKVNAGWREKGAEEKRRAFFPGRLANPHIMGFNVGENREFAGYDEMTLVKKDLTG